MKRVLTLCVALLLLSVLTAPASVITNFWATFDNHDYGFEEDEDSVFANQDNLNAGTEIGSWEDPTRRASIIEYSTRGPNNQYAAFRSNSAAPPYEITALPSMAADLSLGVEFSFLTRLWVGSDTEDNIEDSAHFIELRDTSDNTLVTLRIMGSAAGEPEDMFTHLHYHIGDQWQLASTNLQQRRLATPAYFVHWDQIKLVMNEDEFDIQFANEREGTLETIVSGVEWNLPAGTQIGSIFFTNTDANEEESEARFIRYDDVLLVTIPEPGVGALLAMAGLCLLLGRRMRRV